MLRALVTATVALLSLSFPAQAEAPTPAAAADGPRRVLAISVDGLNPAAIRRLGPDGAPAFHRLRRNGAWTFNARTEHEQTVTLPNHVGMVTSRRIDAARGGHGVDWNDERAGTVQQAAGHPVQSVFSAVHAAGGRTAVFAGKTKLGIFERSWPDGVDRNVIDWDQGALVRRVRSDLVERRRTFTFLHLLLPDAVGHESGFMSRAYVASVRRTDRHIASILHVIRTHPVLNRNLAVIVTADHGGVQPTHGDPTRLGNYRVPFLVWGAGVGHGNLYRMNPDFRDPGRERPTYAGVQPVRNGDLANLALDLLGLPALRGSELDADQTLTVRR